MTSNQPTSSPLPDEATLKTEKRAELGEIVVFIDGHIKTPTILEFAGVLAEEHGARLIAVFLQPEPTVTTAQEFARGEGMRDVMEVHEKEIEGIEAHHRALFENIVRRRGVQSGSEWRSLSRWGQRGGRASVLRRPCGYCPPRARWAIARAFRPCGISGFEFRPTNHSLSAKPDGISGPPQPRGLERHARVHPGRSGCLAAACAGDCRSLDR